MQTFPLRSTDFHVPFRAIRPEEIEPAIDAAIAEADGALAALAAATDRTYENTLGALEALQELVGRPANVLSHLVAVESSDALRKAHNAVEPRITAFFAKLALADELYAAVKAFAETAEAKALTGAKARFLARTRWELEDEGAALPAEKKARVRQLAEELAQATTQFTEHVLDATNLFEAWVTDEALLAGLPPSARAAAKASATAKGRPEAWRFTLHQPSYVAVVTYAEDAALREPIWRARQAIAAAGPHDNRALVAKILALRQEKATLLGAKDFADLVLRRRMAKSGASALGFVEGLIAQTTPAFAREQQELQDFRRGTGDLGAMAPWDVAYWAEKQRRARYELDPEALRPYFPLPAVLDGLFAIVHSLYGITVTERDEPQRWNDAVRYYEVRDEAGVHVGSFYADWHPRESKRGGAWMNHLITGGPRAVDTSAAAPEALAFEPHLGLVCGNLTPPIDGAPALLTHDEVQTVFHEFGHLLHHLLSRVEVKGLAGTNVAWDFVELPSQILENWCWEREALDRFARHVETGAKLPEALLQKMLAARRYRGASAQHRQLSFAYADLLLHTRFDPATDGDPIAWSNGVLAPFQPVAPPEGTAMIASFLHLFGSPVGYAAGYYSYKWAEVLDADAFSRFAEEGVLSRAAGEAFRDAILSQGDARDPAELFHAFLGRPPDPSALLRRVGLIG